MSRLFFLRSSANGHGALLLRTLLKLPFIVQTRSLITELPGSVDADRLKIKTKVD